MSRKAKIRIIAVAFLWLITLAVPLLVYNIPQENRNGGLVSEYKVEYKGNTYRCVTMYPDFSKYENREKIWSGVMKNFWLVKDENGAEFICVSQYGDDFLCEKISDNSSATVSKIIVIAISLSLISALATALALLRKRNER